MGDRKPSRISQIQTTSVPITIVTWTAIIHKGCRVNTRVFKQPKPYIRLLDSSQGMRVFFGWRKTPRDTKSIHVTHTEHRAAKSSLDMRHERQSYTIMNLFKLQQIKAIGN